MPKTPNPITKERDTAMYFDNTGDGGIRCIAAAMSIDAATHIVICAPDAVILKRAWKHLTEATLDLKKAPVVIYKYEPPQEGFIVSEFSVKKKDGVIKVSDLKCETDAKPWYWFYRRKGNLCFIESHQEKESDINLGDAVKCSVDECKRLLRENKIARTYLETMKIDDNTNELIPF